MPSTPQPGDQLLQRSYRLLLLAYPADFRRRVGADMADVFVDLWRHERRTGGVRGMLALAARTLRDVTRNGLGERFG